MLGKRIIPCLDMKEGRVVKGVKFVDLKDAGDPVELAEYYNKEGADELCFLDITASHEKRYIMIDVVRRTAEKVFIPFTVGGGINDLSTISDILKAGADKVSINTAAVKDPNFVKKASDKFGSQCIVVAIDAKRGSGPKTHDPRPAFVKTSAGRPETRDSGLSTHDPGPMWEVYTHGGRTPTGLDAVEWAKKMEKLGAGEILLTSMDRDGTKEGYDLELTKAVSAAVNIPVIASGGAGTLEHILDGFTKGAADAALLASLLHYKELTIREIKDYLANKGIPVRM